MDKEVYKNKKVLNILNIYGYKITIFSAISVFYMVFWALVW